MGLAERHNWSHQTKSGSLRCYLSLMIISKRKNMYWFFPEILMIKESCNLIGRQIKWVTHPIKSSTLICYLSFIAIHQGKSLTHWLIPSRVLMIKESCNLIGRQVQRVTPNQKQCSHMLPFFYLCHQAKSLTHWLIPSRDIDDQKIFQSYWNFGIGVPADS